MGASASLSLALGEDEAQKRSKSIDLTLAEEKEKLMNVVQILLIGEGGSGKSTLSKQIRLIYNKGFSFAERLHFQKIIRQNLVNALSSVLNITVTLPLADDTLDINDDFEDELNLLKNALQSDDSEDVIVDMKEIILRVWGSTPFQERLFGAKEQNKFTPSNKYFLSCLERVISVDYVPTDQDILMVNHRTLGVQETVFHFRGLEYRVCDTGNLSGQLRKWIHCFEQTAALIFTVDMSSYDTPVPGTEGKTLLQDTIKMFGCISNNPGFTNTNIFLILNKRDVFEQKLKISPLSNCFAEYKGAAAYAEASRFVLWQFEKVLEPGRVIYPHFTMATDTGNVRQVLDACLGVIIEDLEQDDG